MGDVSASRHRAQLGDYATVGQKLISLVDTDSFWIDGHFEETSLGRIRDGDPATVKLMGYSQLVRGHVGGVARGINIPNVQPDPAGLASVNPIFTWVRLAQRVPVRIHIEQVVPDGVRLVAGMTGTVQIFSTQTVLPLVDIENPISPDVESKNRRAAIR